MPDPTPAPPVRPGASRLAPPFVVLLAALLTTAAGVAVLSLVVRERNEARFENAVQSAVDRVQGRLDLYTAMLRGGAALFAASDSVSAGEFRAYTGRLGLAENYPGVQGVGFARALPEGTDAVDGQAVWPAGRPGVRSAIVFLEPADVRNRRAMGFDMASDSTRRAAMLRAADAGDAAATGRVRLVQERGPAPQPGFLVYVPVYRGGTVPPPAERRERLLGWVYAPFRAGDLFARLFGRESAPRVDFQVYDGTEPRPEALLYDSRAGRAEAERPRYARRERVTVAGRPWTIELRSHPSWERELGGPGVPIAGAIGVLASVALFAVAHRLSHARAVAEARALALRDARAAAEAAAAGATELAERLQDQAAELEHQVEQSQALNEELERANRAKSDFLAVMSHELRTPLNAIIGYAELLLLGIPAALPAPAAEHVERIRLASRHLLSVIEEILAFSRLEAGREVVRCTPVELDDLVREVAAITRPLAEAKGLALRLPDGVRPATLVTDAGKLRQILVNLLGNAVKFTAAGEIAFEIAPADGAVAFRVRDTGVGIAEADRERIFLPFHQVEAAMTRTTGGTGLGLSVSRSLARLLGGDVTVESEVGRGSTFTVRLPAGGCRETEA